MARAGEGSHGHLRATPSASARRLLLVCQLVGAVDGLRKATPLGDLVGLAHEVGHLVGAQRERPGANFLRNAERPLGFHGLAAGSDPASHDDVRCQVCEHLLLALLGEVDDVVDAVDAEVHGTGAIVSGQVVDRYDLLSHVLFHHSLWGT
jgi:hypothetical protein